MVRLRLLTVFAGVLALLCIGGGAPTSTLWGSTQTALSVTPATVGSRPPGIEHVGLADVATVALVLRARGCPQCEENYPGYKRIIQRCAGNAPRTKVVVLSLDPPYETQQTLASAQVRPDAVFSFPTTNTIDVKTVPAIIVFDKSGTITQSLDGRLETRQEQQLIRLCSTGK